ncbi:MAG TPA: Calx-beta domain-containing protein, partial [Tepidisphaeraceae bacterium]|nr:Calx-beta domain-containing protein [Tepidisphaeraceae bacterium]
SGGTADDDDFDPSAPSAVTIPAGASSAAFTVKAAKDNLVEGTEYLAVAIEMSSQYKLGEPHSATLHVGDVRPISIVSISAQPDQVREGAGTTVTLRLSRPGDWPEPLTVGLAGYGPTATAGEDYDLPATATLPAGSGSEVEVTLTVIDDTLVEGPELARVYVTAPPGGNSDDFDVADPGYAPVTILDDDALVSVTSPQAATEGGPAGSFTVTREGATDLPLTVGLQFVSQFGALAGSDYGTPATSITFAPAQTSRTIPLHAYADDVADGGEAVWVGVRNGDYVVGNGEVTVAIIDVPPPVDPPDDPPPITGGGPPIPGGGPTPPPGSPDPDPDPDPDPPDPDAVQAWVDVSLGGWGWWWWWHGQTVRPDEQWYGSTADGPGLSTGGVLRLNDDFDESADHTGPDAPPLDLAKDGIKPWDGEVAPLWLGAWSGGGGPDDAPPDGEWTLAWPEDKVKVWVADRDDQGYVTGYSQRSSGWSGRLDDLYHGVDVPGWPHGYYWYGLHAWAEPVGASASVDDVEFHATFTPDGGAAVEDTAKATVYGGDRVTVDGNRDGEITSDEDDRTSPSEPYRFWLNDDDDYKDDDDLVQYDRMPDDGMFVRDNSDDGIDERRDMEDFTRVVIELPPASPDATVKLSFRARVGGPAARVMWVKPGEADKYLTDAVTADNLALATYSRGMALVTAGAAPFVVPPTWQRWDGKLHLLLEGVAEGAGELVASLYDDAGRLLEMSAVDLDLRPVSNLYEHWTVGDTVSWGNLRDPGDPGTPAVPIQAYPAVANAASKLTASGPTTATERALYPEDYVLFVHGWRMQPAERRSFAETAYKRLYWQGFKGRFGMFSWPTEWTETDWTDFATSAATRRNYDNSELKAYASAPALRNLIAQLGEADYDVHLLAHSMGNVVASEALRLEAMSASPQHIVKTYVASQAATVASAYDPNVMANSDNHLHAAYGYDAWPKDLRSDTPDIYTNFPATGKAYFENIGSAAEKSYNFFNPNDGAVGQPEVWPANQALKPDFDFFDNLSYGYDTPTNRFFERRQVRDSWGTIIDVQYTYLNLAFGPDAHTAFSFAAEAKSKGLGVT